MPTRCIFVSNKLSGAIYQENFGENFMLVRSCIGALQLVETRQGITAIKTIPISLLLDTLGICSTHSFGKELTQEITPRLLKKLTGKGPKEFLEHFVQNLTQNRHNYKSLLAIHALQTIGLWTTRNTHGGGRG